MFKFKLRTLFILTLLIAICCSLWRCGQLDYQAQKVMDETSYIRTFRAFSYELRIDPPVQTIYVSRVNMWANSDFLEGGPNLLQFKAVIDNSKTSPDTKVFDKNKQVYVKNKHPWNGRHWYAFTSSNILSITWGEPFNIISQAPTWNAVYSINPKFFDYWGIK